MSFVHLAILELVSCTLCHHKGSGAYLYSGGWVVMDSHIHVLSLCVSLYIPLLSLSPPVSSPSPTPFPSFLPLPPPSPSPSPLSLSLSLPPLPLPPPPPPPPSLCIYSGPYSTWRLQAVTSTYLRDTMTRMLPERYVYNTLSCTCMHRCT